MSSYGFQLSASGMMTSLYRLDVYANNLANVTTAAFKPEQVTTMQRDAVRIEDNLPFLPSNELLERLGGGVLMGANHVAFTQGPIQTTGGDLDLAIEGDGFFVVSDHAADGQRVHRLTRDGRLTRDPDGRLVTATGGLPVLDTSGRPITLESDAPVTVGPDGTVRQNGREVGRIQLTTVANPDALTKLGRSLFAADEQLVRTRTPATGRIVQGAIEGSAVNAVDAMMDVTAAAKAIEANARMIGYADQMMDRAINGLGQIA